MQTLYHAARTRGKADHGWLNANHSFSFANYYNPERMNFGALRVLNDDTIAPGMGFGTHPHDNMEIITIPLTGDLEHKDSMGNVGVINEGEIQVMSAGTGVYHSEYNKNPHKPINLLQLWVIPNKNNVEPRYDQRSLLKLKKKNAFYKVLSLIKITMWYGFIRTLGFTSVTLRNLQQLNIRSKRKGMVYMFLSLKEDLKLVIRSLTNVTH